MSASKDGLEPHFATKLVHFEAELLKAGIKVIMTQGYRSIAEQNALYAKGRTAPGNIVTNAPGGASWHNFRRAADYAFVIDGNVTWDGPWDKFGHIAQLCGLEWGGSWTKFRDKPHVQDTGGRTLGQMRKLKLN